MELQAPDICSRPHTRQCFAGLHKVVLRIAPALQGSIINCAHASSAWADQSGRVMQCVIDHVNLQVGAHAGVGLAAGVAAIAAWI